MIQWEQKGTMTMRVRCYFDMLDNCVGYDCGYFTTGFNCVGMAAPVLSAEYNLPDGFEPVGESAMALHGWQIPL
jgi:hypothetical protein